MSRMFFGLIIILAVFCVSGCNIARFASSRPVKLSGLICFWDFQEKAGKPRVSQGHKSYALEEKNGPIARVQDGIFGAYSMEIKPGQWLMIERQDCPALNIHGKREVSIVAWIKRKREGSWQFIAGMWDERDKRQYGLFACGYPLSTRNDQNQEIIPSYRVHGYISDVGGPTPGRSYCYTRAIGAHAVEKDKWEMIAFTYDQKEIKVYCNGELDANSNFNPYAFANMSIYDGGAQGAHFTVAHRAVPSWKGYPQQNPPLNSGFGGRIGGIAVYDRALTAEEIRNLYHSTMTK